MPDTPDADPRAEELIGWVRAARAGSQPAFAQIYRRFVPWVHAVLLARHRPAVADELTQECFATAFAQLSQLQDDGKFGPWIATIARRLRTHEPAATIDLAALSEPAAVGASLDDQTEAAQILRTVTSLPEAYRETLLLRLVEGLSGPEIAALTGLTPASVRVNLHRGMEKLRAALGVSRSIDEEYRHD